MTGEAWLPMGAAETAAVSTSGASASAVGAAPFFRCCARRQAPAPALPRMRHVGVAVAYALPGVRLERHAVA